MILAKKRKALARLYDDKLKKLSWLKLLYTMMILIMVINLMFVYLGLRKITIENISNINLMRNNFMEYLHSKGISTRPGTHAVHMLDYYKNKYEINSEDYINAYIADQCSILFQFILHYHLRN